MYIYISNSTNGPTTLADQEQDACNFYPLGCKGDLNSKDIGVEAQAGVGDEDFTCTNTTHRQWQLANCMLWTADTDAAS